MYCTNQHTNCMVHKSIEKSTEKIATTTQKNIIFFRSTRKEVLLYKKNTIKGVKKYS